MERLKNPYFIIGLLLLTFGINLVIVDLLIVSIKARPENQSQTSLGYTTESPSPNNKTNTSLSTPVIPLVPPVVQVTNPTPPPQPNICPAACIALINKPANSPAPAQKEFSISIQTNGSTQEYLDWYTLPGSEITFNKSNYSGAKSFYFQTNLSTDSTDRYAYARLFDATHGIGITGSDINSQSTSLAQIQSGQLNPFSGNLTLRVQIKGLNGNLVTIGNSRIVVEY